MPCVFLRNFAMPFSSLIMSSTSTSIGSLAGSQGPSLRSAGLLPGPRRQVAWPWARRPWPGSSARAPGACA
eukprot:279100-Prymnesium_polylepis.1